MSDALDEEMGQPVASTSRRQTDSSPSSGRTTRDRKSTVFYQTAESASPTAHIARTTSQQRRLMRRREARAAELAAYEAAKQKNANLERQLRMYQAREGKSLVNGGTTPAVRKEKVVIEISSSDDETPDANPPPPALTPLSPTKSDIGVQQPLKQTARKTFRGSKKSAASTSFWSRGDGDQSSALWKGKGKMRETVEDTEDEGMFGNIPRAKDEDSEDEDEVVIIDETDDERIITSPTLEASSRTTPAALDAILPHAKDRHKSHQFSSNPYTFDISAHIPRRKPLDIEMRGAKGTLNRGGSKKAILDEEVQRRIAVQRTLSSSQTDAEGANYRLESFSSPADNEARAHCVEFFPFSHLKGLEEMEGVYASICGNKLGIFRITSTDGDAISTDDRRDGSRIDVKLLQPALESPIPAMQPSESTGNNRETPALAEEYHSLAWSIDCSSFPFVPILAVAGEAAVINIYRNESSEIMAPSFVFDRSITGHGRRINHLTFAKHHPHVLISASEDATICFWDVTLPWGSNLVVMSSMDYLASRTWGIRQHFIERPRVVGEMLAKVVIGGHPEGVLSCDLHSELPLLISSGTDGAIKVWEIPSSVLVGPNLSTMTALPPRRESRHKRPPSAPPTLSHEVLILGPPIFSSTLVHAGAWVDQVKWNSSRTTEIISKASKIHSESSTRPRTSVKIIQPKMLDLSVLVAAEEEGGERTIREVWDRKKELTGEFLPAIKDYGTLAFDVLREITMEGTNCIGASFGHFEDKSSNLIILGSFLDNSTYFFTDPSLASDPTTGVTTVTSTFPDSREPYEFDFWPRLFPSSITDLTDRFIVSSDEGGGNEGVVWRHFGISREGQWVVAMGHNRSVAIWRRCA